MRTFLLSVLLASVVLAAPYTTTYLENKKVKIEYKIEDYTTKKGKSLLQLDYVVSKQMKADFNRVVKGLQNTALHKKFLDKTDKSMVVKRLGAHAWRAYYLIDMPWPLSNSDIVIDFEENIGAQKYTLIGKGNPSGYAAQGLDRMEYYFAKYEVEKVSNSDVKITIHHITIPSVNAPRWMASSWFPQGPQEIINKLFKL